MSQKKYPKMSKAKQKITIVNGNVFDSREAAAQFVGCSVDTILRRIKDDRWNYHSLKLYPAPSETGLNKLLYITDE